MGADNNAVEAGYDQTLWQTVKGDFSKAGGIGALAVVGVLIWMAFQWGWGNDILLPPIVASAFDLFDDGVTWRSAIGAVGAATLAGSLFWGITQAIDGIVVLSGLQLLPGITQRISTFLRKQGWVKPFDELSFGTKFLIAYVSGASVLCLVDVFATGEPGLRRRGKILAQAVALAVAGVGFVVLIVSAIVAVGARVPASADAAEVVLRYAKNPLTWIVIYGTLIGGSALIKKLVGGSADDDGESGPTLGIPD